MLKEIKRQCKRIKSLQLHLLPPLVSMRTTSNSCLDSLGTSMGNLTISLDNFSSMVTQKFSTYDENFASLAQSMEEINERLRNHDSYLFSFLFLMMLRGRKDDILYLLIIGIMYLTFWLCMMYWLNQINGKKILNGCWKYLAIMLTSCFIGPTWLINIKQLQSRHKYKIIEDQIIEFL
jgi:hypothetical protein